MRLIPQFISSATINFSNSDACRSTTPSSACVMCQVCNVTVEIRLLFGPDLSLAEPEQHDWNANQHLWCFTGQQQILCLARVLLEHPRVVCLDEATANVDPESARLMQHVLTLHLHDTTVLQIAHRLQTILECDWAVVMDQGKVVEQGSPQQLLNDSQSRFASMYRASGSS